MASRERYAFHEGRRIQTKLVIVIAIVKIAECERCYFLQGVVLLLNSNAIQSTL